MDEIHEIMRQFNHGDGEWRQFLKSIKISNIHGWLDQEIQFRFPVVAIVGENGIGKSTFLKAAICAYKNHGGKDFYPSNMFMSTQWDETAISGAQIEYRVKQGNDERVLRWKRTRDWGFAPKGKKPERNVFFLDISRTLPLDATAGYAKIAKLANEEVRNTQLTEESIRELSFILGQSYAGARFVGTNVNQQREVGLLTRECGEVSQFHQGAGEDAMLDTLKVLQSIPNQSLLVIDEVENSLHPQAQRRFVQYLLRLARKKKIQIILSTHSPFVLEELPKIARIMLMRLADRKDVLYEVSSQFALSTIDEQAHPELYIFVEDQEAEILLWSILKNEEEEYQSYCSRIKTKVVGSYHVVETLGDLGRQDKLPYSSLAIVDGDKRTESPNCLSFPGEYAPEKQIILDLKERDWVDLDGRFGMGAGNLFKVLNDATLVPDHHQWTEYIGDKIRKSKDSVWETMVDAWIKSCMDHTQVNGIIEAINAKLASMT